MRREFNFGKNFLKFEHTRKTYKRIAVVATRKHWFS